jgi:hypothetical protein
MLLAPSEVLAQALVRVDLPEDAVAEAPIFEDPQGNRYSTLVVVRFGEHVFNVAKGQTTVGLKEVRSGYSSVTDLFDQLETSYSPRVLRQKVTVLR